MARSLQESDLIFNEEILEKARRVERGKYVRAYAMPNYAMGRNRIIDATHDLEKLPTRGSYLDVGCGMGEALLIAFGLGFRPVMGTEIVPDLLDAGRIFYAEAHALPFPDQSFNVVTMIDVIEHLIPGDDLLACYELKRIARHHILISANNRTSYLHIGEELHINRRDYQDWDALFYEWFVGAKVSWIKEPRQSPSEWWRIDLV